VDLRIFIGVDLMVYQSRVLGSLGASCWSSITFVRCPSCGGWSLCFSYQPTVRCFSCRRQIRLNLAKKPEMIVDTSWDSELGKPGAAHHMFLLSEAAIESDRVGRIILKFRYGPEDWVKWQREQKKRVNQNYRLKKKLAKMEFEDQLKQGRLDALKDGIPGNEGLYLPDGGGIIRLPGRLEYQGTTYHEFYVAGCPRCGHLMLAYTHIKRRTCPYCGQRFGLHLENIFMKTWSREKALAKLTSLNMRKFAPSGVCSVLHREGSSGICRENSNIPRDNNTLAHVGGNFTN
jgi:ribosomal protein S27E